MADKHPEIVPAAKPVSPHPDSDVDLELHVGPLPHAHDFAEYDRILPGAAHRILRMAEREQTSRLRLRWFNWLAELVAMFMGRLFLYVLLAASVFLAINDKPLEALLAGLAPIVVTIYANTRKDDTGSGDGL